MAGRGRGRGPSLLSEGWPLYSLKRSPSSLDRCARQSCPLGVLSVVLYNKLNPCIPKKQKFLDLIYSVALSNCFLHLAVGFPADSQRS